MPTNPVKDFPSNATRYAATAVKFFGIIVTLLGYGFTAAKADNSPAVEGWGQNASVATMAGIAVTLGGVIFSAVSGEKAKSAYEAAKKSPPLDSNGDPDLARTAASFQQQATLAGMHQLVSEIAPILAKHLPTRGSLASNLTYPPKGGDNA